MFESPDQRASHIEPKSLVGFSKERAISIEFGMPRGRSDVAVG